MRTNIILTSEAMERLKSGKCVEGSLRMNAETGKLTFNAWKRRSPKHSEERIIRHLEHGWLKESAKRIKLFSSVKKELGRRMVDVTIHRELKTAMTTLEVEEILNNI